MLGTESLVSFATTFLGAFLALGLTYVYDKHKGKQRERDDRRKVMNTIRYEMAGNVERIERFFKSESDAFQQLENETNESKSSDVGYIKLVPDIRLERAALDTAIYSGKLFLLTEEVLKMLAENYRRIDVVNRTSDDLRVIARGPLSKQHVPMIQALVTTSRGYMQNLQDSLPEAIAKLRETR